MQHVKINVFIRKLTLSNHRGRRRKVNDMKALSLSYVVEMTTKKNKKQKRKQKEKQYIICELKAK